MERPPFKSLRNMGHSPDARVQRYGRSILETAERAAKLTRQLLAFSGRARMASQPVDMHACIISAVALLNQRIDRRISIVTQLNAASAMVLGDRALLESLVTDLGLNARDASPAGGVVRIETNSVQLREDFIASTSSNIQPGNYVEITISDTGAGVAVGNIIAPGVGGTLVGGAVGVVGGGLIGHEEDEDRRNRY